MQALVDGTLASALRGLTPLRQVDLAAATAAVLPDCTAVIVFERQRHANGRDDAFVRPEVHDLLFVGKGVCVARACSA